jgi:hypothetical protein
MDKSALLAMLGPEIKQMVRDYIADVQGDLRVAGDALITGRMSATDLSLDGREVELGWIKDKWVWYYGSASTILIYGEDITEIFPNGTKLRWKQGGGWKYAYVIGTAYASGVNTLTVTGGSDYTVANADIEDNYFSYAATPTGFPGVFSYIPSVTYYGGTTNPTGYSLNAMFSIEGRQVTILISGTFVLGSGDRTVSIFSMPFVLSAGNGAGQTDIGATPAWTSYAFWGSGSVRNFSHGKMARNGTINLLIIGYR